MRKSAFQKCIVNSRLSHVDSSHHDLLSKELELFIARNFFPLMRTRQSSYVFISLFT